jgi:hypothetical protein
VWWAANGAAIWWDVLEVLEKFPMGLPKSSYVFMGPLWVAWSGLIQNWVSVYAGCRFATRGPSQASWPVPPEIPGMHKTHTRDCTANRCACTQYYSPQSGNKP